jgi:hypothetical protein
MKLNEKSYLGPFCISLLAVAVAVLACASFAAPANSGYKLTKKVAVGGDGLWDYLEVDPATHHVFVSRGSHVMALNADGGVIGDIPNTAGVHGIALAPEFNKGFTSDGGDATVTIFDMATFKTLGTAQTDRGPDAIIYDAASKRVFTMNGNGRSATAIDASTGNVAGSVPLGGRPEFAAADGKGHVFAALEDKSQIVELDSKALTLLNTWPLAPCDSPSGVAIDAAHNRLVVGCHNNLMAFVDSTNGKVVATVPIGTGVDANRFDPETGFAFASCGDGTITVAHEDSPDKFTVVDTIQTQSGARTMALDYSDHTVYTVSAQFEAPSADATPAPPPVAGQAPPRPRRQMVAGSFTLLIFKK